MRTSAANPERCAQCHDGEYVEHLGDYYSADVRYGLYLGLLVLGALLVTLTVIVLTRSARGGTAPPE